MDSDQPPEELPAAITDEAKPLFVAPTNAKMAELVATGAMLSTYIAGLENFNTTFQLASETLQRMLRIAKTGFADEIRRCKAGSLPCREKPSTCQREIKLPGAPSVV